MSPRVPNPLALPAEVLSALRVLPEIAERTAAMERHTAVLEEVARGMQEVSDDTTALPGLRKDMARVAETTSVLEPMDGRMSEIQGAMPVLVEVQQHLARLPETIERLDGRIGELSVLLERMLESLDSLSDGISELQQGVGPLGRLARRVPGQSKDE